MGYSFRLTARVLLYAPSHRQDNIYHGICYTSRRALAGTRNSSMGPPHEGSIRRYHRTMSEHSYHGATFVNTGKITSKHSFDKKGFTVLKLTSVLQSSAVSVSEYLPQTLFHASDSRSIKKSIVQNIKSKYLLEYPDTSDIKEMNVNIYY